MFINYLVSKPFALSGNSCRLAYDPMVPAGTNFDRAVAIAQSLIRDAAKMAMGMPITEMIKASLNNPVIDSLKEQPLCPFASALKIFRAGTMNHTRRLVKRKPHGIDTINIGMTTNINSTSWLFAIAEKGVPTG